MSEREASGVAPLSRLLAGAPVAKLTTMRQRFAAIDRERLIHMYRTAFATGMRVNSYLLAEALTAHRVPPCFRLAHPPSARPLSLAQRLDLFVHDTQWLAKRHSAQRQAVKGRRYERLFDEFVHPDEFEWIRETEFWFNGGERDVWVIVRGLGLSERQQWECRWLRSPVVVRKADALTDRRETVYKAIMDHRSTTERGMDVEAAMTVLKRRFKLWLCAQMTRDGTNVSPAAAARLYEMWTGKKIDRGTVGQALQWVKSNVPEAGKRGHGGACKSDIAMSNE